MAILGQSRGTVMACRTQHRFRRALTRVAGRGIRASVRAGVVINRRRLRLGPAAIRSEPISRDTVRQPMCHLGCRRGRLHSSCRHEHSRLHGNNSHHLRGSGHPRHLRVSRCRIGSSLASNRCRASGSRLISRRGRFLLHLGPRRRAVRNGGCCSRSSFSV